MPRKTPLTPIFDYKRRSGSVVVGNTPGNVVPPGIYTILNGTQLSLSERTDWYADEYLIVTRIDISSTPSGVTMIDATDPTSLSIVDTITGSNSTRDVSVSGSSCVTVSSISSNLRTMTLSPSGFTLVASTANNTTPNAGVVLFDGTYAYVGQTHTTSATQSVWVWDCSTLASPTLIGTVTGSASSIYRITEITKSGDYLFVTDQGETLNVIDVSTPSSPSIVSSYSPASAGQRPINLHSLSGNFLYSPSATPSDIVVIDISDPTAPSHVQTLALGGTLEGCYLVKGMLWVTNTDNLVYVCSLDAATGAATLLGSFDAGVSLANGSVNSTGSMVGLGMRPSSGATVFVT